MSELQVNTINETTAANGVVIDGLKVKDYSLMYGSNIGLTVSSDGYVSKPNQPAFCVRGSADQSMVNDGWRIIAFADETTTGLFDSGGDFNTSTYKFVCPVSGKYQFNIALSFDNPRAAPEYFGIQISAGGSTHSFFAGLLDFGQMNGDPAYWSTSGSIILDCSANDEVFWNYIQSSGTDNQTNIRGNDSRFSGFLIG